MKLKNKLSIMTLCIVIFIMTLSTVSVWVIISQQNREASADLIRKSFGVIKDDLSSKREKLLADSRQIAGLSDMNMKIELLGGAEYVLSYALTKNIYREVARVLYDTALMSRAWKMAVYAPDGRLIAFAVISDDDMTLVIVKRKEISAAG